MGRGCQEEEAEAELLRSSSWRWAREAQGGLAGFRELPSQRPAWEAFHAGPVCLGLSLGGARRGRGQGSSPSRRGWMEIAVPIWAMSHRGAF